MSSFQSILSQPAADVKPPKNLPVGTYTCQINAIPEIREAKNFTIVEYVFTILVPEADVDLSDYDGTVQGKSIRHSFMFNNDDAEARQATVFRYRNWMKDVLGIDETDKSIGEMQSETLGKSLKVTTKWDPDKQDPTRVYTRVKDMAAAD